MKIIINGDDFGMSHSINESIRILTEKGVMTSASLIVTRNEDALTEAIDIAKKFSSTMSLGLHLDLDHYFQFDQTNHYGINIRDIIEEYREILSNEKSKIVTEIERQFELMYKNNLKIVHCDSHHNIHLFPEMLEVLFPVFNKHGIKKMRFNDSFYLNSDKMQLLKGVLRDKNLCFPDFFYDLSMVMNNENILKNGYGIVEVMAHTDTEDNSYGRVDQFQYLFQGNFNSWSLVSYKDLG